MHGMPNRKGIGQYDVSRPEGYAASLCTSAARSQQPEEGRLVMTKDSLTRLGGEPVLAAGGDGERLNFLGWNAPVCSDEHWEKEVFSLDRRQTRLGRRRPGAATALVTTLGFMLSPSKSVDTMHDNTEDSFDEVDER